MKSRQAYVVEPKPFVLTLENFHVLYTNSRRLVHWFAEGEVDLVAKLMDPNYYFFWLMANQRPLGLAWVYDINGKSARCGAVAWVRIKNWPDLIKQCFNVFEVDLLLAVIDRENNQLAYRLLTRLGFREEEGVWVLSRQVLQKTP